jgi:NADH-quinone oxidoreductase subunit N
VSAFTGYLPMGIGVLGAAVAMLLGAWDQRGLAVVASVTGLALGAALGTYQALSAPAQASPYWHSIVWLPAVTCLALGAVVVAASTRTLTTSAAGPRIAALAALATVAAAALSSASDLLVLFVAVETLALCGYGLVALGGTARAREAAMKWFVQGSVATAVLIVGIAVLLARTGGSLAYADIAKSAGSGAVSGPLAIGYVFVLAALAFKAGAFPFHSWMPDAFETAPATGAALLASVGKVAPISAALWLTLTIAGPTAARIAPVAAMLALLSIVFGNLAALRQHSLARMLAYSGIAQVGYALVGLALGAVGLSVVVFAVLYGVTSAASFLFVVALREAEPDWDGSITGLAGLSRRHPSLAVSLAVVMFSLTGIPLTAGFWGKFLVFAYAATGGYLWLAIVAMLGSVVSFGYYGAVLRAAFMSPAQPVAIPVADLAEAPPSAAAAPATLATIALALLIVAIGVAPLLTTLDPLSRLVR